MTEDDARLMAVVDGTWSAAALHRAGPWLVREGRGGGKRVSSATAAGPVTEADIALAEAAQDALGQDRLFQIRGEDAVLDAALAARGYRVVDPVVLCTAETARLADPAPDPMSAFAIWPPLGIQRDIWAEAGIGPGRLAVMDRVTGPKTAILGRRKDRAAGTAFVACHDGTAMIHAIEVVPDLRRMGVAAAMIRRAAGWALDQGADRFALVVTVANAPARALYAGLGMVEGGRYHYRLQTPGPGAP